MIEKIIVLPLAHSKYPLSARASPSVPVLANTWPASGGFGNRESSDPSTPPIGNEAFQPANHGCVLAYCNNRTVARGVTKSCPLNPDPSKKTKSSLSIPICCRYCLTTLAPCAVDPFSSPP